jgi:thymidylate synthase
MARGRREGQLTPTIAPWGSVPQPDPTLLTTEAVSRATERFDLAIKGLREIIEARLDAMDQAMARHLEFASGIREQTERLVDHLRVLHDEKFHSIDSKFDERNVWLHEKFDGLNKQFQERDVRTNQATTAAKNALDAALKAASELVAQQNSANTAAAATANASFTKQIDQLTASFTKQLDQITAVISTLEKALDARITELKERIDRGEGGQQGARHVISERRLDAGQWIAVLAVISSIIYVVLVAFGKH